MSAINNTTHWSTPQNVVYTIFQWQIDYLVKRVYAV